MPFLIEKHLLILQYHEQLLKTIQYHYVLVTVLTPFLELPV